MRRITGRMDWTFEPEGDDNPFLEREELGGPQCVAIDFSFDWSYSPATPDVWYLSNGDPGYPGDPAECEITNFKVKSLDFRCRSCDGRGFTINYGDGPYRIDCRECRGQKVTRWVPTEADWAIIINWLEQQIELEGELFNSLMEAVGSYVEESQSYTGD